jgi:hypothetical protein
MSDAADHPMVPSIPFPRRALAPRHRGPDWLAGYEAQHPGSIARLYQAYGGAGPIAVDRAVCQILAPIADRQGVTLTATTLKNYRTRRLGLKTTCEYQPIAPAPTSPQEPSRPAVLPPETLSPAPAPGATPSTEAVLLVCHHCERGMIQFSLGPVQWREMWAYMAQAAQVPLGDEPRQT